MAETRNLRRPAVETEKTVVKEIMSSPAVKDAPAPEADRNPLITDDIIKYLNYRIEQEEYSSRIYLAMSMWLDNKGYVNAAKIWRKYSNEELEHADWSRTHLLSFGVQPVTPKLDSPEQSFAGLPEIIKMSYDHEIEVTKQIQVMAKDSMTKGDYMVHELALRFLKEQVEEHNKMQNWMDQLKSFGTDKTAMRLLDHEMKDYL
jgi:ferritin